LYVQLPGTPLFAAAVVMAVFLKARHLMPRPCLKNDNMLKERIFSRATLPNFLEIHKVFLQKFVFAARKNLSLLCTLLFIKQGLV